ncbi:MAG: DUF4845 domain-containing protein [Gammaproteobacteria bacterium]
MHRQQRGVTAIGWIFLLIPVGLVLYSVIRLFPVYMNYLSITRIMTQQASESQSSDSAQSIKNGLEKRLDIDSVTFPDTKDFVIRRDGQSWVIEVAYEEPVPLMGNLSLLATFAKTVSTGKATE